MRFGSKIYVEKLGFSLIVAKDKGFVNIVESRIIRTKISISSSNPSSSGVQKRIEEKLTESLSSAIHVTKM
jgi:hypothetical protein